MSYLSLPILVLLVRHAFMEFYVISYKICFNMKKNYYLWLIRASSDPSHIVHWQNLFAKRKLYWVGSTKMPTLHLLLSASLSKFLGSWDFSKSRKSNLEKVSGSFLSVQSYLSSSWKIFLREVVFCSLHPTHLSIVGTGSIKTRC